MFSFLLHGYCNNIYLGKGWVARYVCICKRKSCVACKYSVFHVPGFFSSTRENQIRSNARGQRIIHGFFYQILLFLPYSPHPHSPLYKKPMTKPALETCLFPPIFQSPFHFAFTLSFNLCTHQCFLRLFPVCRYTFCKTP